MKNLQFEKEIQQIISIYKHNSKEPLDGDEVDRLVNHIKNQINLIEGNITYREYERLEK